ncbi:hypothetical protein EDC04DRAFT_2666053 [Pisolithus marmoratus]|nr:hypothetical protein EDC04DRAFT_2666053 [Pisolithus marmoratus]
MACQLTMKSFTICFLSVSGLPFRRVLDCAKILHQPRIEILFPSTSRFRHPTSFHSPASSNSRMNQNLPCDCSGPQIVIRYALVFTL